MSLSIPKPGFAPFFQTVAITLLLYMVPGTLRADNAAAEAPQLLLKEDQVARFSGSLPDMHALGKRFAETSTHELNPDSPLDPFMALSDAAILQDPELTETLKVHGFASLRDWLNVGRAVMLAYMLNDDMLHNLAAQTARMIISMKGGEEPDPMVYSRLISRLKADMIANIKERPLPENVRLIKKYRAMIERGLRGVY